MKKVLLAVLLVMICAAAVSAGGSQSAKKSGEIEIWFVTPLIAHPVWLDSKIAFEQACKDLGVKGAWVGPAGINIDEMIKQIDLAIASKVSGIITMPLNPEAMRPALKRATDAGIPVVLMNSDDPLVDRLAYLGLGNKNFGETQAATALKYLNGRKPVIAAMVADLTQASAREMLQAAEAAFKAAGPYEWVTTVAGSNDLAGEVQKYQEIFTTYPNVNVVLNIVADGGSAAAKVVEERGLQGVCIVGISDMEDTLDYIKKGTIYATLTENYTRMGYQPVQWLVEYIKTGGKPAAVVNDTGTIPVTQQNLTTYKQELADRSLWN
ncbi:MAG: substrate-binding domain-containing protein [Treponema sp.]|jgi:ABC-type sugar transport system substrate-binding protein|nr:substrate-binding domain-containing protein [Treponema sp.]